MSWKTPGLPPDLSPQTNYWLACRAKKPNRAGLEAEQQCAKMLNGTVIKGSGAIAWNKGDLDLPNNLKAEVKSTSKKSLSVKREWLGKITGEALSAGKEPAFVMAFTDEAGNVGDCWIAMPDWVYRDLIEKLEGPDCCWGIE